MQMEVYINSKSKEAIYLQIYEQIRDQIVSFKLKENERLPSIRALALDLNVSVITVKNAYELLEQNAYIYSIPAKGTYVNKLDMKKVEEEYTELALSHLHSIRKIQKLLGKNDDWLTSLKEEESK